MKVLIIRYSAIGDIILTTGPLKVLKDELPELEIHLVTSEAGAELLNGFVFIDQIHALDKRTGFLKLLKTIKKLGPFDKIIDLQNKPKTSILRFFLKTQFISADNQSFKRRLFVKKGKYAELLKKHVVEKYYEAFKKAFELPDKNREELRPFLVSKKIIENKNQTRKKIAIHPYASQKNKIWPYTQELIKKIEESGLECVVIGETNEPLLLDKSDLTLNLTNKTSLKEMSSIIASCAAFVSTDSGPMHLGIALNTPTLAIFGPTTKEFGFYPDFKNTKVVEEKDLECRPCHVHGGNSCPLSHHQCMKNISAEKVFVELKKLL